MTQNIARAVSVPEGSPEGTKPRNPLQRHPYEPAYLFEAAIAPLGHLPVKGVLWYQGESNAHDLELHEQLFRLLEQSWRRHFARRWSCEFQKKPDLPFYVVQLSSLSRPSWPAFRDSQRRLFFSDALRPRKKKRVRHALFRKQTRKTRPRFLMPFNCRPRARLHAQNDCFLFFRHQL